MAERQATERKHWPLRKACTALTRPLALVAAIGGVASAIISGWALSVSQKALLASQEAAKEAHRQADQATTQTGIFQRQVEISADANRMNAENSRAWIAIINAEMKEPLQVGVKIDVKVTYNNIGKEPAKMTFHDANISSFSLADWDAKLVEQYVYFYRNACFSSNSKTVQELVFPTSSAIYGFTISSSEEYISKSKRLAVDEGILSGGNVVTLTGCMSYITVSALKHTAFCFYYRAGLIDASRLAICPFGNDAE